MPKDSFFHFKQFSVRHQQSMKVGTDSVLLGAWANVAQVQRILDVGTGSGLLALMMAQRCTAARIDAIELDAPAAEEAQFNFAQSPWADRLRLFQGNVLEWQPPHRYELIIANPPYFQNSLLPPAPARAQARHTQTLHAEDLLRWAKPWLTTKGRVSIVLPVTEGEHLSQQRCSFGLFLSRKTIVRSRAHKPPERLLVEFSRETGPPHETELVIHESNDCWSESYRRLTEPFYTKG